jgi:hypothetical protein
MEGRGGTNRVDELFCYTVSGKVLVVTFWVWSVKISEKTLTPLSAKGPILILQRVSPVRVEGKLPSPLPKKTLGLHLESFSFFPPALLTPTIAASHDTPKLTR